MTRNDRDVQVPTGLHLQTRFVTSTQQLWELLGNLESTILREEIRSTRIDRPIYLCGLPRSGTTITTEILSRHKALGCHRYADFPFTYTPFWRAWLSKRSRFHTLVATERSHKDRIMVTLDSPEAVEEVIWMHFFHDLHDPRQSNVLDGGTSNPRFESFYRDHIRKLLLARRRARYLAKGNYNITRLEYLLRLLPDARFVILIRDPVNHIASLMKQHRHFIEAFRKDPRVGWQLAASGHFEFGPQRVCTNYGDADEVRRIEECWREGREVEGWARYWNGIYGNLADRVADNAQLADAMIAVRYETLCSESTATLFEILTHCGLDHRSFECDIEELSGILSLPQYYQPEFTDTELTLIADLTGKTAAHFGYTT